MTKLQRGTKTVRVALTAASLLVGFSIAGMANAAVQVVGPAATVSQCTNFTFNVTITACAGGYEGNLLQSSVTDMTARTALTALGAPGTGVFLEPKLEGLNSDTGVINFGTPLTGVTVFGFHAGGAGDGAQGTFFFQFDAGAGVDAITITDRLNSNATGLSNAALFRTGGSAVPEPATWAMMMLGVGATGFALRRRATPRLQAA